MKCQLCDERVRLYERAPDVRGAHRECMLRACLGGIGHIRDHDFWCGVVGDPDAGLSFRESAREVAIWWQTAA